MVCPAWLRLQALAHDLGQAPGLRVAQFGEVVVRMNRPVGHIERRDRCAVDVTLRGARN